LIQPIQEPAVGIQSIGLFEAKTHLSELVARAEQGDEVIITRHNRPVARIVPIGRPLQAGVQRRQLALDALQDFDPIRIDGATPQALVEAGRT
jgi:prevent-host-death family protein